MTKFEPVTIEQGRVDYAIAWTKMRAFTAARDGQCTDELWLIEHPPVYTHGSASLETHVLDAGDVPVVRTDRGGQVTYHGPGQAIVYCLLDLRRLSLGPRQLVGAIEAAVVHSLRKYDLDAYGNHDARGVYIDDKKIASIGLRITRGCCYHGVALNVDMDLEPFSRINPCGYPGLEVTQLAEYCPGVDTTLVGRHLARQLILNIQSTITSE